VPNPQAGVRWFGHHRLSKITVHGVRPMIESRSPATVHALLHFATA
jgi:hypothetical protein